MKLSQNIFVWRNRFRLIVYPLVVLCIVLFRHAPRLYEAVWMMLLGGMLLAELLELGQSNSTTMWRAMKMARRERALFKAAAEGSQQAFYVCRVMCDDSNRVVDFRIVHANSAAAKLLGHSRSELVGTPVSALLPKASKMQIMGVWSRVAATGVAESIQIPVGLGGSEETTRTARVVALSNGVAVTILHGMNEEVTDKRVQDMHDFAQSIIQSAPISMIATDLNGTIVAMNSAAERLTLYRKRDLVGEHSLVLLHDPLELSTRAVQLSKHLEVPMEAGFQTLVANVRSGEPEEREWAYMRKDGTRASVNLTMTALRTADGKTTGYLAIAFDIAERKELVDSVVHMAHHDQLTGLPNRVLLLDRLAQAIERSKRFSQEMAVFTIDIDHFKRINDSLGHAAGNTLLTLIARQLISAVRRTDTVARIGGDEFVVMMPDFRSLDDAERCAALMLQKIAMPHIIGSREVLVTASIGYCLFPQSATTPEELLQKADIAMYEAKAAGRANSQAFSEEMARGAVEKLEIEEDLRGALENNEFRLHYQPQIRCATGEVIGMEGLLRWESPKRGNVPPAVFIPIAEESGLLVQIGEWVIRQACFDCKRAEALVGKPLSMAVNISPSQFNQQNLGAMIESALEKAGLSAERLEIEITEQLLMTNTPNILATLEKLRDIGVSVAIDDFGTGFSSLSYVMQYKVDRLKIDQSFIAQSTVDPGAASVVRTIIAMAHGLKIDVVAEGVETIDQLSLLLRKRCDVAQGFLFSKAVPLEQFANAVAEIESWVSTQQKMATRAVEAKSNRTLQAQLSTEGWQASMIAR